MWCLVSFNIFFTINILPACTARASQLEGRVTILESALAQQEEILVAAQEEMQEKILAADERLGLVETSLYIFLRSLLRYAGLRSVNIHLEGNILELQERWVSAWFEENYSSLLRYISRQEVRRDGERKEEVLATSFLRALVLAPVL